MRALAIPWTAAELERRYRAAATPLAARRYQALWLRAQGIGMREAAATVGVTTETLRAWIKRGVAEGLDALAGRKPGSGGRPKLTAAQREQVLGWVDAEPRASIPALRRRIAEAWGVSLSEPQVWKLVRRGGGRPVVPRRQHYQADLAAQARAEKN
ncbi:MAG TPA: helix-turn-helix domain-containing protein [Thermomicrobiales bacterium]|jgi:transposase